MGLMTRKLHDKYMEAIDAADGCISAAVAQSEYAGRLFPFMDDYVEISVMFWDRCPKTNKKLELPGLDVKEIAHAFNVLIIGMPISGLESFKYNRVMERCRRKVKGKLYQTRMIMDAKKKGDCLNDEDHLQPCMCKPLRLSELAQMKEAL
jgi:hypothetical protein